MDGLKDRCGRNKSKDELSAVEKLKAENLLLKAEKKRQQVEMYIFCLPIVVILVLLYHPDVGSETHYARAFDWRNFEFTRKPLVFSNTEAGFLTFKAWIEEIQEKNGKTAVIPGMEPTGHYCAHIWGA